MSYGKTNDDPFGAARAMILGDLITGFFKAESDFKKKVIDDLVVKNNKALEWPSPPNCFQFRTIVYRHSSMNSFQATTKLMTGTPVIHRSLEPEILKLIAGWEQVEEDRQKLKQLLSILLKPCVNRQQARAAVPEFLVRHSPMLATSGYRIAPFEEYACFTEAQWDDYNRLLPRLHIYNGSAMLI